MILPKISIVTTCLNDAKYLAEAMDSIHSQGYPDLEHIVIDGGSTDGSVDIIKAYANRLAYWVSEPDEGHADALHKGMCRMSGEVINWICSNDRLLPGSLERVGRFFHQHPEVDWTVGNGLTIDEQSRVIERVWAVPFTVGSILYWDMWGTPQPAAFIRRSAFEAVGGIDRSLNVSPDTDLFLRLARRQVPARIPYFVGALRIHRNSQTLRLAERLRETDDRLKKHAGRRDGPPALLKLAYRLYHLRYRGWQILNETFRREKYYMPGAPIGARHA